MKGFVPTPTALVDEMVRKLLRTVNVSAATTLLDPGCGEGQFIAGVRRWCKATGQPVPQMLGVEQHPGRADEARRRFKDIPQITIVASDFLVPSAQRFDLIIGNPPYVSLGSLSAEERESYRSRYRTARGRFDLYMLFFEQALTLLKPTGRLVFVTPEKFTYVDSARVLRRLMLERSVHELHFVSEDSFDGFVTYPVVTTIGPTQDYSRTHVSLRSGESYDVQLHGDDSWQSIIRAEPATHAGPTLDDVCIRVSCGVATGADAAYIVRDVDMDRDLRRFAHPTVSGRQLRRAGLETARSFMLVPYDHNGRLLPEQRLGALAHYLSAPARKAMLTARTCTARKPWYAFHDNAPLNEILRPKILCKDIAPEPFFVADTEGTVVPRHSTYYIVPHDPAVLPELLAYLNSSDASQWLLAHCQRAANGFLRLQSGVLKRLPVPESLVPAQPFSSQLEMETLTISA